MIVLSVLEVLAAVGCALVVGLLFAFSVSVMTGLGRLPAARGAAAMQAINVAILNPVFLVAFVGTALVCAALIVVALVTGGSAWSVLGAVLYLVGPIGVTAVVNVPMNNALDRLDADSAEGAGYWELYRVRWTAWNHVRVVIGVLGIACLALA